MPGLHRRLDRPPLVDMTQVRRLGVLRPYGMGDVVLTTGLLRELRQQLPSTRITFKPRKCWPRQRYLDVIREIEGRRDVAFLAMGGPDVMEDCLWLSGRAAGVVTYSGDQLPVGAIWAAIAQCDLYLGNDTGLMHMAAAQIPVVAVIGVAGEAPPGTRGDASHTGPYGTPSRLVRPPAGTSTDGALDTTLVPVSAVATATLELLT